MLMDLIENNNFNKKSLGGPSLNDLTRFKNYCYPLYEYRRILQQDGVIPFDTPKVVWFIKPQSYDIKDFENQVKRRLNDEAIQQAYTEMSQQQIDDIITCAASIYIRGDYSMKFKYTDLSKVKNFIAFESGVICFYPPHDTFNIESGDAFNV